MNALVVVLRLIHVVGGVLWVGFAAFLPFYLVPALAEAGPEGGKVMMALQRRGLTTIMPVLAVLSMVAGLALMWVVSGGSPDFFKSPMAHTLSLGALLAIVAFVVGMAIARPSMLKAAAAMASLSPSATADERARALATAQRLRQRGGRAAQWSAILLLLAAACMAVARYL